MCAIGQILMVAVEFGSSAACARKQMPALCI
jgi:hypothetical protein